MGLVAKVLEMGVLLTEVYVDTVGDAEKYRIKISERFPGIKFVVAKKADSLYPVVSGASIVAKAIVQHPLPTGYLDLDDYSPSKLFADLVGDSLLVAKCPDVFVGWFFASDPETKAWLGHHKHPIFGFPTLVRFSWGTCTPYFKEITEVLWEADKQDEDGSDSKSGRRQLKLTSLGVTGCKRKVEDMESSAKGRCKFFHARKLEQLLRGHLYVSNSWAWHPSLGASNAEAIRGMGRQPHALVSLWMGADIISTDTYASLKFLVAMRPTI
ncbi:hypothetical protein ACLOJK_012007 [Asimina triloba]